MKKLGTHIRNIYIYLVTLLGIVALYRRRARKQGPLVRVVVFHDVTEKAWFVSLIAYMKKHYHILSPEAFFSKRFEEDKINILITFDDGYDSWVRVCAPVLAEHGVHALFFINSGLLDTHGAPEAQAQYLTHNLLLKRPRNILSWDGLRTFKEQGHTIGGHTQSHVRLSQLSVSEQVREVVEDKKAIEHHLETPLIAFAYPFGRSTDYTPESMEVIKDAGYSHAFTTESRFVPIHLSDTHAIPRMCVEDNLTQKQLGRWIEGGYDVYAYTMKLCVQ